MKRTTAVCGLLLLVLCGFSYSLWRYQAAFHVPMSAKVRSVSTFNNCLGFASDALTPRLFKATGEKQAQEAFLRFALAAFNPTGYRLTMKVRGPRALLEACYLRSATGCSVKEKVLHDDVAEFDVDLSDVSKFVWSDGTCYVGIGFPVSSLREGDEVELVDFRFELK